MTEKEELQGLAVDMAGSIRVTVEFGQYDNGPMGFEFKAKDMSGGLITTLHEERLFEPQFLIEVQYQVEQAMKRLGANYHHRKKMEAQQAQCDD